MSKKKEVVVDVVELCPYCGAANEYASADIGDAMLAKCWDCGRWIVLCDRCEDHSHCDKCKWCDEAEKKNKDEGLE